MSCVKNVLIFLFLLAFIGGTSGRAKKGANGTIRVGFHHRVGTSVLHLDDSLYHNFYGQSFSITMFKYYVGKFHLMSASKMSSSIEEYFLVNEELPETKEIIIRHVHPGLYDRLSFLLGVDSIDNCSGPQDGALDPVNAMFWTWNSGYIFLKVEGKSAYSKSPGNFLEYHIGGYRRPYNCIREISLPLKMPLVVREGDTAKVDIYVDAGKIFNSPNPVNFEKISSVTDFHFSTMIADNIAGIFTLE